MNPLDLPLPERKRDVVITDGMIDYAATLRKEDAEGKTGTSVHFVIPAGEHYLPPAGDARFRYDWGRGAGGKMRSTAETYIALTGAEAAAGGKTIIRGTPESRGLFNLPPYCQGIWRFGHLEAYDIGGHAITFGTGPYNNFVHIGIIEKLKGARCTGNWMMLASEQEGTQVSGNPDLTKCNDERYIVDTELSDAGHEHVIYNDLCKLTVVRRCKLWGGPHHPFKSISRWNDVQHCLFSNVNPDTLIADRTYGHNSEMSLVAVNGGYYYKVHTLKIWPENQNAGPGGYAIGIQPRFDMMDNFPELADPSSDEYWREVESHGWDNPDNPLLRPHTHYFEECTFEAKIRADRPGFRPSVIGHGSSHPMRYGRSSRRGSYHPRPPTSALWRERSRTLMLNCTNPGFGQWYKQALFWATEPGTGWPEYDPVIARDEGFRQPRMFSTKPDWWPSYQAPLPPDEPPAPVTLERLDLRVTELERWRATMETR